jgi:hypothetical protein
MPQSRNSGLWFGVWRRKCCLRISVGSSDLPLSAARCQTWTLAGSPPNGFKRHMEDSDTANGIPFHIVRRIPHRRWQIWGPRFQRVKYRRLLPKAHVGGQGWRKSTGNTQRFIISSVSYCYCVEYSLHSTEDGAAGPRWHGLMSRARVTQNDPTALKYGILSWLRLPTKHPLLSKNLPVPPIW